MLSSRTAGLFGVETRSYYVSWLGWNWLADQACLNLRGPCASASEVLGIKVQGPHLKSVHYPSEMTFLICLATCHYQLRVFHVQNEAHLPNHSVAEPETELGVLTTAASAPPPPPAVPIVSVEESGGLGVQLPINCWLSTHEALGSIPTGREEEERKRARDEGGREGKNQSVSMAP